MVRFMSLSELGDVAPRDNNLVAKLRNVSLMHWQPYPLIVKGTEFLLSLYQFIPCDMAGFILTIRVQYLRLL
jgi:hypothetical protein